MDNQNNRNKQNLPGNNNPNNKNNRQRWNIILFTVMLISFIVFALYQFREDTDAREITYDQFLNMVDSGEVKKVVIEDDKIVITAKTEAEMKNSKKKNSRIIDSSFRFLFLWNLWPVSTAGCRSQCQTGVHAATHSFLSESLQDSHWLPV